MGVRRPESCVFSPLIHTSSGPTASTSVMVAWREAFWRSYSTQALSFQRRTTGLPGMVMPVVGPVMMNCAPWVPVIQTLSGEAASTS